MPSTPDRGSSLLRALSNTGISITYCDLEFKVVWAENIPSAWSRHPVDGKQLTDFLPSGVANDLIRAKHDVVATGVSRKLEICIPAEGGSAWFAIWLDVDRTPEGEICGVMATAVDITDQKHREQTLRTLLREVAHRSKNLLAIIQSIATQTGRHAENVDGFLSRFRGRLQSLASTQDLVTSSNWRGASLMELIVGQVGRYTADPHRNIRIEGDQPYLNPNAALHIGLALHELAVNSVSYGALARPDGHVTITTQIQARPAVPALSIKWSEGISVSSRSVGQRRFGSVALERVVPAALNGSAKLELTDTKLTYSLLVPEGSYETE
ncbi:HWE histidine kinase domain-containing protein [Mesorhizobium sp. LHD-90]|uniref:sensor histidine kinase n=1 Tax=Mesorhizobium sp. LHD-90 TaxID=3071414 RepID=UPI0027DF2171|nr:HWE histidine kinase domain-containing protein [Mesorhizobium sp. LHD-90]MDQ6433587.1 HWE histidine kinase domain-containing protein [Mesorhizobium sp. LHD-90]